MHFESVESIEYLPLSVVLIKSIDDGNEVPCEFRA